MPGGDRRGPSGYGPMTGRAAGFCAGSGAPGFTNAIPGRGCRGFGFGAGFGHGGRGGGFRFFRQGRGFRWEYPPGGWNSERNFAPSREDELEFLKNELRVREETIGELKRSIAELQEKKEP